MFASESKPLPAYTFLLVLVPLVLFAFWPVLFRDEQFAFRDAAQFYYPLYQVIQQEWAAGRIPLWNPWENAGMPMLGNPTAAVLYPGKLIYALAPSYAWGARLYTILHVLLAVGAMYALMRAWGASRSAASIAGIAYGFGGPIFFQYCNIVFLVGAAWAPLGLLAADQLVRLGQRRAAVGLAFVLAMQALGGDPQAAYLVGLASVGYALGLWRSRLPRKPERGRRLPGWAWLLGALVGWFVLTVAAGRWLPLLRPPALQTQPFPTFPWTPHWSKILLAVWAVVAIVFGMAWRKRPDGRWMIRGLAWLVSSGVLAGLLAAAQLVPVTEFSGLSVRASREASHEIYAFSVEPYRIIELLWPNFFGFGFGEETSWHFLVPPFQGKTIWVFSLYLGAPVLVLALSAAGWRAGPPWRAWLTFIAIIGLLGALGTTTSPLWYARFFPSLASPDFLGAHDPAEVGPIRADGKLRDGDGGVYWFLATALPGFGSFRYPAKLLTFSTLGLAGLAGLGWDQLRSGSRRPASILGALFVALTLAGLAVVLIGRSQILAALESSPLSRVGGSFGPIVPEATWRALVASLAHALTALVLFDLVVRAGRRRPSWRWVELLAVVVVALDVGVAARGVLLTVPQSVIDRDEKPKVLQIIDQAEAQEPSDGPYRIHRMAAWNPPRWKLDRSAQRGREFVEWERDTIQPKYGLPFGVHYTEAIGTAELFDNMFFFSPFMRRLRANGAEVLNAPVGAEVVYFPRRGFDLWNSRYFILPIFPGGWKDEFRGYAAFLPNTSPVYPRPDQLEQMTDDQRRQVEREDFQILRNEQAFPRAWVVHKFRFVEPIRGMRKRDRIPVMNEILYPNDTFWSDPNLNLFDPREMAWVETEDRQALAPFHTGGPPLPGEKVEVFEENPSRTILRARLERPGIVVLAETHYPGWRLTIDGQPAPILRVNRMMRGAAVPSGDHELVYSFQPRSFLLGSLITAVGLVLSLVLLLRLPSRRASSTSPPESLPPTPTLIK